ncbi:hypothetical protein C2E23DRAFT_858909 [Lenzites betulinus]|nr:hypothetical protein C2E23DRAFT_858909 [Lenzites betulinus]
MGPLLIGVVLAGVMYGGAQHAQLYYYFTRYSKDPWSLKFFILTQFLRKVTLVWATDSVHQALISQTIYWYLVSEYGNPAALNELPKTLIAEVFFNIFTGFFVQSFFVVRIWRLSGKKLILVVPVAALVLGEFAVGMTYSIKAVFLTTFAEVNGLKGLSISINALAAAGDVSIAIIMCTILNSSRTGFTKSNMLINKLMVFSVNTGLLTSICACLSLITIVALPDTFVYITFFFLLGRLYCNSLLATLNARKSLRDGSSRGDTSMSLRDIQPSTAGNLSTFTQRGRDITIRIDTTKDTRHDTEEWGSDKHPIDSSEEV